MIVRHAQPLLYSTTTRLSATTLPCSASALSANRRAAAFQTPLAPRALFSRFPVRRNLAAIFIVSSLHRAASSSSSDSHHPTQAGRREPLNMDPHAYTALPIAAARAMAFMQSDDPIIRDPLAAKLVAGETHLMNGANVEYMSMRCLLGDELVRERHAQAGVRQVVSLGAGMDSRAFRLNLLDTTFYEVDKQGLFDVKEPLVADVPLECAARRLVVGTLGEMDLGAKLRAAGFDSAKPTVWLLEGLLPYISRERMPQLARDIGALSAAGSGLWGDGFSQTSVDRGMVFHGVAFESGFDNYAELFRDGGFDRADVVDFTGIHLDRGKRAMRIDPRYVLTPATTRGHGMCLMVRAYKSSKGRDSEL
ncbi:S-adenosyl-L-methionine-dependent methyltransferase [Baffinella frigidus]|nr:S-adenosyl-L-methionine-dependent methyltransferase [Cryptophyta sp. CCMP2293]